MQKNNTIFYNAAGVNFYYTCSIMAKIINGKKQTYIYDLKNQLSSVRDEAGSALETYKYDASGNILEKVINGQKTNYSYDKGNQLASSTVNGLKTDYNYDAAGRMSSETTAGVTKTYTYGWLDKVTKVQAGDSVTTFSYYADGQLAQKKSGETVENFYWDELALLRRGDTNYINDPAVTGGNPVLADNTILFTDMLGNTLGSVENEVFQPIGRTAFGETNSKLASANLDFFTGKPQVDGLGYNFLLRNYNAKVGKWQTQDPLGYPDGWNNFAYCNSDVLNAVDAMGGEEESSSKKWVFDKIVLISGLSKDNQTYTLQQGTYSSGIQWKDEYDFSLTTSNNSVTALATVIKYKLVNNIWTVERILYTAYSYTEFNISIDADTGNTYVSTTKQVNSISDPKTLITTATVDSQNSTDRTFTLYASSTLNPYYSTYIKPTFEIKVKQE